MKSGDLNPDQLAPNLQAISEQTRELAKNCQGNSLAILALLRTLESLHQEIRDGLFQDSLPNNRQLLYGLLRDIEMSGGWPYIHRMKLRSLLKNFSTVFSEGTNTNLTSTCSSIVRSEEQEETR